MDEIRKLIHELVQFAGTAAPEAFYPTCGCKACEGIQSEVRRAQDKLERAIEEYAALADIIELPGG